MPTNLQFPECVFNLFSLFWSRRSWIFGSAAAGTTFALLAAIVHRPDWQATQAMLIRDVAIASISVPGQFLDADSRKAAQEMVVELANSPPVVASALKRMGTPAQRDNPNWPTTREVEEVARKIEIRAPQGAEFGSTEMFYLLVQQPG